MTRLISRSSLPGLVCCLGACAADPSPVWAVENGGIAAPSADGSVVVYNGALLRVSSTGQIVSNVALDGKSSLLAMGLDNTGAPILGFEDEIVGYDFAFNQRWSVAVHSLLAFAVSPAGQTAFVFEDDATPSSSFLTYLTYLDAAGRSQWSVQADVATLLVAPNGDVLAFEVAPASGADRPVHRLRHTATNGAVVEDLMFPAIANGPNYPPKYEYDLLPTSDGGLIEIEDPYLSTIARVGPSGATLWTRSLQTDVHAVVLSSNDDLVVSTPTTMQMLRLDGTTGETRRAQDTSYAPWLDRDLVSADAEGYVLIQGDDGYVAPMGTTLERYAGP